MSGAPPWTHAALGLGASLGDRARALRLAVYALQARPDVHVEAASRVYATSPVGGVASHGFLNAVIRVRTTLPPLALLQVCKAIEQRLGRRPTRRWADRVLDIDILLYGDQVVAEPGLRIPHPRLAERDFFLAALAEAWPDAPNPWTRLRWTDTLRARGAWPVVGTLPVVRE
ncbi:MAG: 2-amino-4-hydroxy-6-hydroxymethyldihydropteridine diphosphokinase [Pseudomonadota bacterium]|nr:2-amino-4-hydroxy-6-hydroxymethyldihydropteridine diphosphokinase [Pseudomonadota bacterium]